MKNSKKLIGEVVSNKTSQTLVVAVAVIKRHDKYRKPFQMHKRIKVHVETGEYQVGDKVEIEDSRPVSKDKRWKVIKKI